MRFKWILGTVGALAVVGVLTTASLSAGGNLFNKDSEPEGTPTPSQQQANLPPEDTVPPGSLQGSEGDNTGIEPIFADPGDGSGECQPERDLASCDGDMIDEGPGIVSPGDGGSDTPVTSDDGVDSVKGQEMLEKAAQDLAARLVIDVSEITLLLMEQVEWPDGSLGNPNTLALYFPVITPGYRILLEANGQVYEYHTDMEDRVEWIEFPRVEDNEVDPATPPQDEPAKVAQPAPIEDAQISVAESFPPQYFLNVKYGLPSGCAEPGGYEVERNGDVITVTVSTLLPADPETICTMIYGIDSYNIPLGSDFESGHTYTVLVNDQELTFTAQ